MTLMVLFNHNTNSIAILNFLFPENKKKREREEYKHTKGLDCLVVSLFHLLLLVIVDFV